jgi:hypothetical protein
MSNKREIVMHCPECHKLLAKQIYLDVGNYFVIKCYYCQKEVKVEADYRLGIHARRNEKNILDKKN